MEASGSPTPPPEEPPRATPPPPPPPPPDRAPVDEGKAGGGWRALGVLLALALAFACAVMVIAMVDIGGTPRCDDPAGIAEALAEGENECFDGSSAQKVITLVLGWPSGILAGIAALVALFFAATGRRGRLVLQLTAAAVVLGVLSIVIGSV
jgi:membrane-associated PAP2 superfamily phosphatase